MRVISEGPTKITKATVDGAWRPSEAGSTADCPGQGLPGLGAYREPDRHDMVLCLPPARKRSTDRTPLAQQDGHHRQPDHALAR